VRKVICASFVGRSSRWLSFAICCGFWFGPLKAQADPLASGSCALTNKGSFALTRMRTEAGVLLPSGYCAAGVKVGRVVAMCVIDTHGFPQECRIKSNEGDPVLGQTVLAALTGLDRPHYTPAKRNGIAVPEEHMWVEDFQSEH
jgi:hypothetical protein